MDAKQSLSSQLVILAGLASPCSERAGLPYLASFGISIPMSRISILTCCEYTS
jgi:hypothetical protein